MPGFGDGPFGHEPFGKWPWSRQVLFDFLPSLYRDQDANNGGVLETWTESLRYSFDIFSEKIADWRTLRDPLTVRTQYNETATIRLGPIEIPDTPILQRGVDGAISALRIFSSPTARFRQEDAGRQLILSNSGVPVNNRIFKISAIVGTTSVRCDPPLVVDPGPISWAVQDNPVLPAGVLAIETRGGDVSKINPGWTLFDGFSQFQVYARQQFFPVTGQTKTLTEREGVAGIVLSDGRFQAEVSFLQKDVGKPFTVSGSSQSFNNGKYEIYFVDPATPSILQFHIPLTIPGADANGGVVYTLQLGQANVQVQHTYSGTSQPLFVQVSGNTITVNLQTNLSGTPVSTATQVAAALNASVMASALIAATFTGTGASLVGVTTYQTVLGARLLLDPGPLVWALLPFPQLQIYAAAPPAGIVEQEGVDAQVTATFTIKASTGKFSSSDIGKSLILRGSLLGNTGTYSISSFVNVNEVGVTPTPPAAESSLTWEARTRSAIGDLTQATVSATSLIQYLAQDFGIEVDQQESEARQRSWVENVTQWIDLKGLEKAYKVIGAISGFNVTISALYRIGNALANTAIPSTDVYIVGESDTGRHGIDGYLTLVGGQVRFSSPSAIFKISDVGLSVQAKNCSNLSNDKVYTIGAFISPTTVEFIPTDTAVTPDYGIAGTLLPFAPLIQWEVCRIYTDLPPSRPLFDDVNVELMQYIVGTNNFLVDTYCWDPVLITSFPVSIFSATPAVSSGVPINVQLLVDGVTLAGPIYTSCGVIGAVGRWRLTDLSGNVFYVETVPTQVLAGPPPRHTFQIFSSVVPTLGAATLEYFCEPQESCDYCKSSNVLAIIEEGTILEESGVHIEKVLERVVTRLENEVKPAHVRLILIFRRTLSASLSLTATVTTP